MAEPSYWQAVPTPDIWDPLTNAADFVEVAAEQGTEAGGSWARDDASVTLVGDIPWNKKYDARRKMTGYAYADTGTPWALHRVNPLPHPEERHLRCVSVDIAGYNPWAVDQGGGTYRGGLPADDIPAPPAGAILLPRVATYSRARCTLKFRPHPYPFFTDAEMVAASLPEVFRNTSFFDSCDPTLDVLLTDSAPFLKWAEGAGLENNTINSQTPEYIQRANLVAIWHHVPANFIIKDLVPEYIPAKIMAGVGKVNHDTWYGFPAGTLRLEAPRFRRAVQACIRTSTTAGLIPFVYDVMLPFSYVNPTAAEASPIYRGWNLYPNGPTGKWYSVKRSAGVPDPQPYFEFYDFDLLFEHVLA